MIQNRSILYEFLRLQKKSQNPSYPTTLKRFIAFTEREEYNENQKFPNKLYPFNNKGYSLLEICCYHGAVDCFKFLRTNFDSEITQTCLKFSFLGGNPEIIHECLKYQKPTRYCMQYAIISHNIDFVTFLMNEYNIKIDLMYCGMYKNLESFLVYFDQTHDINKCFIYSTNFGIPSLCKYFLSLGANANEKDLFEDTALHIATKNNYKETIEILLSYGANINEKDKNEETALHFAVSNNNKEITDILISHGANIDEKNTFGRKVLHFAAENNSVITAELLISLGANINYPLNFESFVNLISR
ncbi:hypothetical protein TVAG_398840 [Trichomonas vaginalis G3]|uniref:DUF3447 domain-containing protein n=1 Tax=Trichomonas vaginalis (strain ATCC PRA-98 / G3) TaxID=412133 RepID=A2EVH3_TRIV3|nr:hypothetical protein TVAG_398840 [Trichomonas vaginalis G3]|eukprot:XP_001315582.1 hypothetical protein [Trichomonas vaginalis G3]